MKNRFAPRRDRRASSGGRLVLETLESRLLLTVGPWSIDDQIALVGDHLTIRGTTVEDLFEVTAGSEIRVTLNGQSRQFEPGAIGKITVQADHADQVILHDTAGDDTIRGGPGEVQVVADGLVVESAGAGQIVVVADAGGVDEAHLTDSAGDEFFLA
ncbi:MAG: hypothetical protein ACYC6Y_06680, partial [Thermoguttaceae bacterium]